MMRITTAAMITAALLLAGCSSSGAAKTYPTGIKTPIAAGQDMRGQGTKDPAAPNLIAAQAPASSPASMPPKTTVPTRTTSRTPSPSPSLSTSAAPTPRVTGAPPPTQPATVAAGSVDAHVYSGYVTTGAIGAGANATPVTAAYTLWQTPDDQLVVRLEANGITTCDPMISVDAVAKIIQTRTQGTGVLWQQSQWGNVQFFLYGSVASGDGVVFTAVSGAQTWFRTVDPNHPDQDCVSLAGAQQLDA